MRPIRLQISGLNSFRKSTTIEFDGLVRDGLFGIFGPTGSGKSTILDAITLALFGRVHRAPANLRGVINVLEKSCSVSFTFEIENHAGRTRYVAERSLRRTKSDGVETKQARLLEQTEEGLVPLTDKTSEMRERVQELLGIKLDDFLRAVVLPQGEFAEFLDLEPRERGTMLQSLFGLDLYGLQLQNIVKERLAHLSTAEAKLEERVRGLADSDDGALLRASTEFEEAERELEQWKSLLNCCEAVAKEAEEIKRIEIARVEASDARSSSAQLLDALGKEYEEIDRRCATELPKLKETIGALEAVAKDRDIIAAKQDQLATAESMLATASEKYDAADARHEEMSNELAASDRTIDELLAEGSALLISYEERRRLADLLSLVDNRSNAVGNLDTLRQAMAAAELQRQANDQEETTLREQATVLSKALAKSDEKLVGLQGESDEMNRRIEEEMDRLVSATGKERVIEVLRQELSDGEPCPLCGALDHPLREHITSIADVSIDQTSPTSTISTLEQLRKEHAAIALRIKKERKGNELLREERSALDAKLVAQRIVAEHALGEGERLGDQEKELRRELTVIDEALSTAGGEEELRRRAVAIEEGEKRRNDIDQLVAKAREDVAEQRRAVAGLATEMNNAKGEREIAMHECDRLRGEIAPLALHHDELIVDLVPKELRDQPIERVITFYSEEHDRLDLQRRSVEAALSEAKRTESEAEASHDALQQAGVEAEQRCAEAERNLDALPGAAELLAKHVAEGDRRDVAGIIATRDDARTRHDRGVRSSAVARDRYDTCLLRNKEWQKAVAEGSESTSERSTTEALMKYLRGNGFVDFLANEHLAEICRRASVQLAELTGGRYSVTTRPGEGFTIEDNALAGASRPPGSLSGGETFLVSLSLALALSDTMQINRGAPLEFFFLDEGFGTLDSELLDVVITSLERLCSDRRAIGVISHVASLRERIPRRLTVEPPTATEGSWVITNY